MARRVSDREDLLRDGTQMPIRGCCTSNGCEVFIGFRSQGQASLYWDQDPVYQFNSASELRRVFYKGQRYAALDGSLSFLKSKQMSQPASVTSHLSLSRLEVTAETTQVIMNRFTEIKAILLGETLAWECVGVATPDEFSDRVTMWLLSFTSPLIIAASPNA